MRIVPSSTRRCPAMSRSLCLADAGMLVFSGSRKRSCTALATLFTFWPPGPDERMNFHSSSSSVIATRSEISSGTAAPSIAPGRGMMQVDLALGDGDGDAVFLEKRPNPPIHLGAHVVHALLRIRDPESQLELDAMVAELHQPRHRRRIAQHAPLSFAGLLQDLQRDLWVVVVADAHGKLQPDPGIRIAPIDHGAGYQLLIRHQH